jgi:hypothetical protein
VPTDPKGSVWKEHIIDNDIDFAHGLVVCDINDDGNIGVFTYPLKKVYSRDTFSERS